MWKRIPTRIMRIAPAHITVTYPFNILLLNASGPIYLFMWKGNEENKPKLKRREDTRACPTPTIPAHDKKVSTNINIYGKIYISIINFSVSVSLLFIFSTSSNSKG